MLAVLALLGAFEFVCPGGPASAMLAGGAVPDWRHGLTLNPALAGPDHVVGGAAMHARPYGLDGLSWGRAGVNWQGRSLSVSAATASLALGSYGENDVQVCLAGSPVRQTRIGIGAHALIERMGRAGSDVVPAVDVGGSYSVGTLMLGAAALGLNAPRWRDGTDLAAKVVVSGAWRPVPTLLLALDITRQEAAERAAFGVEFRIIPQAGLRFGVATEPLQYAGGVGLEIGPVMVDYAWRFHPQLKGTHIIGLTGAWH